MSINENSSISFNQQSARRTDQPLAVRKPGLGQAFNLTGKGVLRQCVHIQESFGTSDLIADRYLTVDPSVAGVALTWASPVLFHEAIPQCGDRFAFPQILDDEYALKDQLLHSTDEQQEAQ